MDAIERQREREVMSVQRGLERYRDSVESDRERGREWDGPVGSQAIAKMLDNVIPAVHAHQKAARAKLVQAQTVGTRLSGWEMPFASSDPEAMAYITLKTILMSSGSLYSRHVMLKKIGTYVNQELRWAQLREGEKKRAKELGVFNRVEMLKRSVKQINPKSLSKWLKRLSDIETTVWSDEVRMKIGAELLGLVLATCGKYVKQTSFVESRMAGPVTQHKIEPTDFLKEMIVNEHGVREYTHPWLIPMVCPPVLWAKREGTYTGGYLTMEVPLIKSRFRGVGTDPLGMSWDVPQVCLDALNAISSTAWCINERVLEIAGLVQDQGLREVAPVEPPLPFPPSVPDDVWEKMSIEERRVVKAERKEIWGHNAKAASKQELLDRVLDLAKALVAEPAIYFPHNLDFRGRAYPMPQDLHPQGPDICRGLLKFSEGVPLGKEGLRWLVYATACAYGEDKCSRDEQYDWVMDRLDSIASVATDPTGVGYDFWKEADEPWQFLAACIELEAAFNHPGGAWEYPSQLPVSVDGSCNGLQHLSAMGLDPVGAHATNLTRDPQRQDIYQIVADKVVQRIKEDRELDNIEPVCPHAANWWGKVTRKTVKRGVMTTPYGVTRIGMRDQLIRDGATTDVAEANYLRDRMEEAIDSTVVAGREIMTWMQDNAHILGMNGLPVSWITPVGFNVKQEYRATARKTLRTLLGEIVFYRKGEEEQKLIVRKQVAAVAPNIIHSYDAAHMTLTVDAATECGVPAFAVVHDSFGCHAAHMDTLLRILREQFVNIYKNNWFEVLQWCFQQTAGDIPLVSPPERGDFDIEEVLEAQYFFA